MQAQAAESSGFAGRFAAFFERKGWEQFVLNPMFETG
jgi:hypothetical protein